MNVTRKNGSFIFEIPDEIPRYNPYMDDGEQKLLGTYTSLTGLISKDEHGNEQLGWANTIDMDYKGKDDQFGDYRVMYWGKKDEFLKICKEIGVGVADISYLHNEKIACLKD